jgi:hypothetical protein
MRGYRQDSCWGESHFAIALLFLLIPHESNRLFFGWLGWSHQFTHGVDETGDGLVIGIPLALNATLQFCQFLR